MNQSRLTRLLYRLAVVGLCVVLTGFWVGCEEAPDSAVSKQNVKSIDEAGRLLRSSNQELVMTASEVERASSAGKTQLAGQIVKRIESQADLTNYNKMLADLDQLNKDLDGGDSEALRKMSAQILSANRELLIQQERINSQASQENAQRLEKGIATLQQAKSQAQKSGKRSAQAGPEMMLGTFYLLTARQNRDQLSRQEALIRTKEAFLGRFLQAVAREQNVSLGLMGQNPAEALNQLKARLEGPEGLRSQLAQTEETLVQLSTREQQLQQQYQQNLEKAQQLNRQYLSVVEQADAARGQERYELEQQAYKIRTGESEGEGSIYYEAQSELAQNELDVLNIRLDYERLRQERLAQGIVDMEKMTGQFEDPAISTALQKSLQQSAQYSRDVVTALEGRLAELKEAQQSYSESRAEVVGAYEKSRAAFRSAAQVAKESNTKNYTRKLAELVTAELAQLWQDDARHYEIATGALAQLGNITEAAVEMRTSYEEQTTRAQESAAQVME
jgi:hypothetical protein